MIELYYNPKDPRYLFLLADDAKTQVRTLGRDHKYHVKELPEISALEEYLNVIPSYQFMPSFAGIRKPVVFLEKKRIGERVIWFCLTGLWKEIMDWGRVHNVEVRGIYNLTDHGNPNKTKDESIKLTPFNLTIEEFTNMVKDWGLNLEVRGYQYDAPWKILHYRQSMSELATRAGKTLMAYVIFRYMLEYGGAHNILMVVPSISLVKQGIKDMNEYQEFFTSEAIWAEGEYCSGANLTIGTFQSLVKRCVPGKHGKINKHYNPKFFDKFDVVCIDECHKADCESIKHIMAQPFIKNTKLIFGFSGTLPATGSIESFGCQALLGPCIQKIETMDLVEAGYLAKPIIHQVRIKYPEDLNQDYIKYGEYLCSNFVTSGGKRVLLPKEERDMNIKHLKRLPEVLQSSRNYMESGKLSVQQYVADIVDMCKAQGANLLNLEQMIATHSQRKLDTIVEIIRNWEGSNGIVFAHNEPYVDWLEDALQAHFPDRPVYKIKGNTTVKKRGKILEALNTKDTNAILVASFGTVATGLTFKNVDYAIFAQSFKSPIIIQQALGVPLIQVTA